MASLESDNIVVIHCLHVSEIWTDMRGDFIRGGTIVLAWKKKKKKWFLNNLLFLFLIETLSFDICPRHIPYIIIIIVLH